MHVKRFMIRWLAVLAGLFLWTGCGKDVPAPNANAQKPAGANSPAPSNKPNDAKPSQNTVPSSPSVPKVPPIKPLTLGALSGGDSSSGGQNQSQSAAGKDTMSSVLEAMKPLQIFLGDWNTTTRNMGGKRQVDLGFSHRQKAARFGDEHQGSSVF